MSFWYDADRVSVIVQFLGLLQKPYRNKILDTLFERFLAQLHILNNK
jgi:hypothetical protein